MDNNETAQEPQDDNEKTKWHKWGANTRFGLQKQPSPEAKRAGWERKRRNESLAKYLLGLEFAGKSPEFKMKVAKYFGLNEHEAKDLTNEAMIYLVQIGNAIERGDTQAANLILERAFGKAKPIDLPEDNSRPTLNIQVIQTNDMPEIKTQEDDNLQVQPE